MHGSGRAGGTGHGPGRAGPPLPRRLLLRRAAGALAVAGVGGAALSACGGRHPGGTPLNPREQLVLQPNGTLTWTTTTQALYEAALQPFLALHRGVDVRVVPSRGRGNVQDILAGTAADVISDNYPPAYMSPAGNLLLPLDHRIQADGVDLSRWSPAQIASYRQSTPDRMLYMLPGYFSPLIYVVRLTDFDEAHLARPDAGWTQTDFVELCQKLTRASAGAVQRYGAVVEWNSQALGEATWPFYAFGRGTQDSSGNAVLASAAGIQAGRFLYEQLLWPGYATTRDRMGPWYDTTEVIDDRVSMQLVWDGLVLDNAQRYTGFAWDYLPPPVFPQGPTCQGTDDFFAIPATTAHPNTAWALLQFLTADATASGWQQAVMKIGLLEPCLNELWDVWIATVGAVAPALKSKHLEYFKELAVSGRAFPEQYWRYADSQCQDLTAPHFAALWSHSVGVTAAFSAIDGEVNALLARASSVAAVQSKAAAAIAKVTPGPNAVYPAPPRHGWGLASTPAGTLVAHDSAKGIWTILGDGASLGDGNPSGDAVDNAVFATAAVTASQGEWTCRVSAIANLSCRNAAGKLAPDPWLKVGLMARGDLSDDAAMVGVFVTGGHGLAVQTRGLPGVAAVTTAGLTPTGPGGKPGALTRPLGTPVADYLIAAVWLRLRRQGQTWTALASLDGRTFVALGGPRPCRGLGAAWIGVTACAHNGDIGGLGYIRAVLDHVSFTPTDNVQLGVLGVPPAAGSVPANWAG